MWLVQLLLLDFPQNERHDADGKRTNRAVIYLFVSSMSINHKMCGNYFLAFFLASEWNDSGGMAPARDLAATSMDITAVVLATTMAVPILEASTSRMSILLKDRESHLWSIISQFFALWKDLCDHYCNDRRKWTKNTSALLQCKVKRKFSDNLNAITVQSSSPQFPGKQVFHRLLHVVDFCGDGLHFLNSEFGNNNDFRWDKLFF